MHGVTQRRTITQIVFVYLHNFNTYFSDDQMKIEAHVDDIYVYNLLV